jgi:hypothetical protein
MAERGREVAVSGGHVQDDHGTAFGLRNIAAICHWTVLSPGTDGTTAGRVSGELAAVLRELATRPA